MAMSRSEQPGTPGNNISKSSMNSVPFGPVGLRRPGPSATLTVSDVWYALFRHKWKVLLVWLVGIAAAAGLYLKNKPPYVSEAKLLVRYVVESRTVEALGPDGGISRPPSTAANIVNSEGEIIQSMDLCRQVAESIGPAKILGKVESGGTSNIIGAAEVLYRGLSVQVPKVSNVIKLSMTHSDPEVARLALQQLIDLYFKRHAEIHRGLGTIDAILAQQTDQIRSRLLQTDEELRELRTKAGVVSLEDTKREHAQQMGIIRQAIFATESELVEYNKGLTKSVEVSTATNVVAATNFMMGAPLATNQPVIVERSPEYLKSLAMRLQSLRQQESDLRELRAKAGPVSPDDAKHSYTEQIVRVRQKIIAAELELAEYSTNLKGMEANATNTYPVSSISGVQVQDRTKTAGTNSSLLATTNLIGSSDRFMEYKALLMRLESLHRQEQELRSIYTDENRTLVRVRAQLAEAETSRKAIEQENPSFPVFFDPSNLRQASSSGSTSVPMMSAPGTLGMDPGRAIKLEEKLKFLRGQMENLRQEAAALEQFETSQNQLLRRRELDEKNYRHFAAGLDQARFDEALGSGKLANIRVVQDPSPPLLSEGKRMKISSVVLAAGILGGIGLALLIEMTLDHSVRRSAHLETAMALPLLSTIPRVRVGSREVKARITNGDHSVQKTSGAVGPDIPGWSLGHPLRSHIEALRDRTIMHFEGDLRKPKLIGVTGCRDGAGVTTIACALAAALSESADGRVLLINLDADSQSLHSLLLGQEACSVVDVVEAGKRETALIGNNLYMASGHGDGSGNAILHPMSIARMLPKIKMSDYDYVVFDMPTVSPTSITGKLAGMVDLVFMVVESEKDSQNKLKRACELLTENNASFRIVLNKFEQYVPRWLDQDS